MNTWLDRDRHTVCVGWTLHTRLNPFFAVLRNSNLLIFECVCGDRAHSTTRSYVRSGTDVRLGGLGSDLCSEHFKLFFFFFAQVSCLDEGYVQTTTYWFEDQAFTNLWFYIIAICQKMGIVMLKCKRFKQPNL